MKFRTALTLPISNLQLEHGDVVVSLGSCFSENMGRKLSYYGFYVNNNAFGTVFHPLALARIIHAALDSKMVSRTCERDGTFFSYDTHSTISAESIEGLNAVLQEKCLNWVDDIRRARLLIVTFGSSWGYWLDDEVVANCHKMPASLFSKRLSQVEKMKGAWDSVIERIQQLNPRLHVLFTVSPVRHMKDGVIENTWSKARLLDLAHQLKGEYFPAYEIMMDDLRDYRFYAQDMIHPNETAIDYIFDQFSKAMIASDTSDTFSQIHKLRKAQEHRVMTNDGAKAHEFEVKTKQKISELLQRYPSIVW